MRWKGLIFLAVVVGIVVMLSLIFTDRWLEHRLEGLGEVIVGAKVDIYHLDFSFTGLHFRWDSLEVADPKDTWKNLVETSECEFDMMLLPLLSRKVVIENWQLSGLQTGTKRTTDGKLEKPPKKKQKPKKPNFINKTIQRLQGEVATAPAWNLDQYTRKVNLDSIMSLLQIRSPTKIDSLKQNLGQKYTQWESTFAKVNFERDFGQIEDNLKSIQPKQINTLTELNQALTTVNDTKRQVDSLKSFVTTSKKNLTDDLATARGSLSQVDNWIKRDYQQAMAQAKLPDFSAQNIGKFIFGAKVVSQVNRVLNLVGKAREYAAKVKSDKPKKEKPPRLKGQVVHFPQQHPIPDLWIKKIELSGVTPQQVQLSGVVSDLVSNQRLVGKTTNIALSGTRADGAALDIGGVLDYLGEQPSEAFHLKMSQIPLASVKLSDSPLLPYQVKKGQGAIESSLELAGDSFNGLIKFTGANLEFDFSDQPTSASKLQQTIRTVVAGASTVDFISKISGHDDDLSFSLNSNLDNLLADQLRSIVSKEVDQAKQKLQAHVDLEVEKHRAELEQFVRDKQTQLEGEMKKYEDMLNEKIVLVENKKKEIESRIEEEKRKQTNKLKDKAKKKLNNLFNP